MSWDMWHVTGTGFDTSLVTADKYKEFILNHKESLKAVMNDDTVNNLVDYLTDRPNSTDNYVIDMDDIREMMFTWTISEPIAYIMYQETGICFDYPGVTEYGEDCVLFTSRDPWNYSQIERDLTYERLREIMGKYAGELGIKVDNYDLIDDEYNNSVMIYVESAWAPPTDLFDAIKDYCDISCDYIASEPMCDIFVNTNPEVFDQIFDLTTDDDDYYPASEEELLSIAKDYGLNPRSYEELKAMIFNDKSGDLTCWTVHAYTNEEDEPWYLIRRKEEEKS